MSEMNPSEVQNADLIGFRVWERIVERGRILRQLYDLSAFASDPLLSQIPFFEEMVQGPNGPVRRGEPLTLETTRSNLLQQLSTNSQILRTLAAAYLSETNDGNTGNSVEPEK
jgi:hypothetical protein